MRTENSVRDDIARALGSEYELVRELGRGGASVVYLARDRVLGREVAVKVIRDSHSSDTEAVARFEREAKTLASLQHPNIVMLYGAKQLPGGSLALVMQHGEWNTLKGVIRERGPLPIEAVQQVLRDLANALAYLHRHNVIHRDIKPENIFIESETGKALLSDFGIAKSGDARSSVTLTGVVIGTPAYMSPEQIDGGQLTGRSDLYSLGMVGYEMLTGERPWEGESLFGVIYKQKTEKLPSLRERRPETPESLQRLIEQATEKLPEARVASAQAFLEMLGEASGPVPPTWAELPVQAAPEPLPPTEYPTLEVDQSLFTEMAANTVRPRRSRGRRYMAAAVVVLIFSGGAGALAFSGREPTEDPQELAALEQTTGAMELRGADAPGREPLPLAADTPAFTIEEVVDSAPITRPEPPIREEPRPQPARTAAVTRQPTRPQPQPQPEEEEKADSLIYIDGPPPALLPSMTVTRARETAPNSGSRLVDRPLGGGVPGARAPELRNRERIMELMAERYPTDLRSRGVGGTTVLTVLVSPNGGVQESRIVSSSGSPRLDAAARAIAARMLFAHPEDRTPQPVWVSVPLTFDPR